MIKTFHLLFVLLSIISFVGRVILSETFPSILKKKIVNIAPHIINTLLIFTGIALIFEGGWLYTSYGWIVAKVIALLIYIGLGVITIRLRGTNRWLAFAGAMSCLVYIGIVAVTKNPMFFL